MSKQIFLSFACLSMLGVASLAPIFVAAPANASVTLAQSSSSQKAVADRLNQEGLQALRVSQYRIALEKFQAALNIYKQIGDRTGEGSILNNIGGVYHNLGQYQKALENYQRSFGIRKGIGDRSGEGTTLNNIGAVYHYLGQYPKALETYQKVLVISKEIGDRAREGTILNNIGAVYYSLGQYAKALETYQQSLTITKEIGDRAREGTILNNIGAVYARLGQHAKALETYQQSLVVLRTIGDRAGEGKTLNNIGEVYQSLGQYAKALETYQQSLVVFRTIGDRAGEGKILNNIGESYYNLADYAKALAIYQKSLAISKEIGDRAGEATTLNGIGAIYYDLGENKKAIALFQESLAISKEIGNYEGRERQLNKVASTYNISGPYSTALEINQLVLVVSKEIGDRAGEATTLNGIGKAHTYLGQYNQAIEAYKKSLVISQEIGDRAGKVTTFNGIGEVYTYLGQYNQAIEVYKKSLVISQEMGLRVIEGGSHGGIGKAHTYLQQYDKAIEAYKKSLVISQESRDSFGEAATLNGIGEVYTYLEQYNQAIEAFKGSLVISRVIGLRVIEGRSLKGIGEVYSLLKQYKNAMEAYQSSLVISRKIVDRAGEGTTLNNIGAVYETLKQPESAIGFLKQAINIFELIRQDNRLLTRVQQDSYTKTVESPYRKLADLLLSQGRFLEAQQVLELLKIQEIYSIDRENRATLTPSRIEYTPTENEIRKQHGNLVALGEKYYACENTSKCTEIQKSQLRSKLQALQQQFDKTLAEAEAKAKTKIRNMAVEGKNDFIKGNQNLVEAQSGTLLVYPFVTEDKIWLLWTSAGGVYGSTEMPTVGRVKLLQAVQDYRSRLQTPTTDPAELAKLQQSGQQLYQWLIKPLEPALAAKTIKHLIFSLDGTTRYIPVSALVTPNKKYLIEQYDISTVLSVGLTNTSDRLPKSPQLSSVLGLGVSLGFPPEFKALTNVEPELKTIVKAPGDTTGLYPGQKFLNINFNQQTLADHIKGQNILHIATHAKYLSTNPTESYLLLGNGQKYMIREIEYLRNLGNVHLVVLSACETGLGETNSDGKEIQGISAYFTGGESKAKAVLSSLWKVNDASTSELMKSFYQNLSKGTMTKSEALRQAQLSMIKNTSPQNYSHPYYWAPFVLIGNGF